MPVRPKLKLLTSGARNTRILSAVFMSAWLGACSSTIHREPPQELGIVQSASEVGPREYVFCDMMGGPWGCASVSQKTPTTSVSHAKQVVGRLSSPESAGSLNKGQGSDDSARIVYDGSKPVGEILFDFDSSDITPRAKIVLLDLLDSLRGKKLLFRGYTDAIGGGDYNDALAMRRALSVQAFFLNAGFSSADLSVEGEGLCCYVASNESDAGRSRNRRVEIFLPVKRQGADK